MAARRFLWLVLAGLVIVLAAAFAYAIWGDRLIRAATVPSIPFAASPQAAAPDYARADAWLARPGKASGAAFAPPGYRAAPRPAAAVFYVAPTAYIRADRWNMALDDAEANARLDGYLRAQASVFNGMGAVWAPAYRQATFGAFLIAGPAPLAAIDLAFRDVARAWEAFLAANPSGPIVLAGHSQGSLHLIRLLAQRIARDPAARDRVVAAYLPGWPISVEADLPALGLPACATPDATGCVLSWQSFAEPADPARLRLAFAATPGWSGRPRAGTAMLCTNPLRGFATTAPAVANANLGALRPGVDAATAPTVVARAAGARCAGGILLIGPPPLGFDGFVLPGNNYHVYDWHLFWANLRADAERRLGVWMTANPPP